MSNRMGWVPRRRPVPRPPAARVAIAPATVLACLMPAACGSTSAGSAHTSGTNGAVSVLYAGSLVALMEDHLGPAFSRASGRGYEGFGGGSTEVANEIKGGVRRGDVFVSASAKADRALEGPANGGWVSWYSTFAASPLVLAYNPHSRLAGEFRRGVPWYRVLAQNGIRVGRTDPKLDPKGVLTVEAVEGAAGRMHDPALSRALTSFEVFPETGLVGRLQSGQLDAGFLYSDEAVGAHLLTVPLAPVGKSAEYTVTVLNRAQVPSGAAAFVRYLLSAAGSASLTRNGLDPQRPRFSGNAAAVPAGLRGVVGAG